MIGSLQEPCAQKAGTIRRWQRERLHAPLEIGRVLDKVHLAMAGQRYSQEDIFAVCLALEEAVVNAIKHGHHGNREKRVLIKYRVGPDAIFMMVKDQGDGFDPALVPDPRDPENLERPSGRGLLLIHTYMTWVRHNGRGNCVTMCKCRMPAPLAWDPRSTSKA